MKSQPNKYWFSNDEITGYGCVPTGEIFIFDAEDFPKIKNTPWYRCNKLSNSGSYIGNCKGICIHRYIVSAPSGLEIDDINMNPLDNRKMNLRICTHQQNQCNQPLQKNNTSGVTGFSYYAPRSKYRARIKVIQHDIHLGYYHTLLQAIQARNEGMKITFGEFGRYNDVPETPLWIKDKVKIICSRFIDDKSAVFYCGGNL